MVKTEVIGVSNFGASSIPSKLQQRDGQREGQVQLLEKLNVRCAHDKSV